MKKLYWVNLILIILLLFSSCAASKNVTAYENDTINLAEEELNQNDLKGAIDVYSSALNRVSSEKLSYNKLLLLLQNENYETADVLAVLSFEQYPNSLSFFKARIEIYQEQGLTDKAIEICEEILKLSPWDEATITTCLNLLEEKGDDQLLFEKAKSIFESGYYNDVILNILANYDYSYSGIRDYYLQKSDTENSSNNNPD